MDDLQPYSEYAREARNRLSDVRDILNSDYLPGYGPNDVDVDGRSDALTLIRYARMVLESGRFRLTPEIKQALRDLAEREG